MKLRELAASLILLLCVAVAAGAQVQTGTIEGTITDPQGAVIPGAQVTVRNVETNVSRSVTSGAKGGFSVSGLPFGTYAVSIEAQGFRRWETLNVPVVTAQVTTVRAQLTLGSVTEVVTVEAGQEVLNTVTTELQTDINRQQILNLPISGRNPITLVTLQAGVTGTSTRNSHINGLREGYSTITQDGIAVEDNYLRSGEGLFAINAPTVEATGEFSISSQNIGSDSGGAVAQIRMSTTRGGNELHGSIFYFHRNDKLNANEWFNNRDGRKADGTLVSPKEREREHRFGFRVGGPLYVPGLYDGRDESFWFFRYEGFRENASSTETRTVMSSAARQGMFSYVASCSSNPCGTHPQTGLPVNSGDLVTLDLIALGSGLPVNPFAMQFINATPTPNVVGVTGDDINTGGFRFTARGTAERDRYAIRVDQKLFEGDRAGTHWAEVVYHQADFLTDPDFLNNDEASFPRGIAVNCFGRICASGAQASTRKLLSTAIHSTFGATVFNEARFGFNRAPVTFDNGLGADGFPRSFAVNFPSTITEPENRDLTNGRSAPNYTFIDNFTKVLGSHSFKGGVNITSTSTVVRSDDNILPVVNIGSSSSNPTGLATSEFPGSSSSIRSRARGIFSSLTGQVASVSQRFNATDPTLGFVPRAADESFLRERAFNFYFQDSWRMRPDLTLNYGVRYELVKPVDMVNKRAVQPPGNREGLFITGDSTTLFQPDPSITYGDILSGAVPPTQLVLAGTSNGNPFWETDKNNFAPFVGIAWSMNPKTVIRTGFSVSYVRDGLSVVDNAVTANDGLIFDASDSLAAVNFGLAVDPSIDFSLAPPPLTLPISQLDNFIGTSGGSTVFTIDQDLRTPYVLQWSFGIQREISPSMALEVRYVGNHGVKLLRGIDFNQIDIRGNGMLDEFFRAQNNLAVCRANAAACIAAQQAAGVPSSQRTDDNYLNWGLPGQVPLPIIDAMGIPGSPGNFFSSTNLATSSSLRGDLDDDEAGQFTHTLAINCNFFFWLTSGSACPGLASFPANFFRANPMIFNADSVGNHSRSTYHGLQVEFRRRMAGGLFFQGNYTFAKVLTDFGGSSASFSAFTDLGQMDYDYARAGFDITHHFNFNGIWDFPLGRGRRWASEGVLGKILEGWQLGGIWTWRSGEPTSIVSGRGTLNRAGRSGANGVILLDGRTADDVCDAIQLRRTPDNIFAFPAEFINAANGEGNTALFGHPAAGTLGLQKLGQNGCDNPRVFDLDANLIKRTYFTETANFEFRFEVFNVFNTPNFSVGASEDIDSSTFGIPFQRGTPREIQFNFRINF